MALTIEDGSGVAGANSYVSLADAIAWASARAIDVDMSEGLLLRAMDYLESLRAEYQGYKTDSTQSLQFPRAGLFLDGALFASDDIPTELISAQCQLACDAATMTLLPSGDGREVQSESYAKGVYSTTDSKGSGGAAKPRLRAVEAFLAPLLKTATTGAWLQTVRV